MANPSSGYSDDAQDFLSTYDRKIKSDPRLEEHLDMIGDFGRDYERSNALLNTFYAEAYKDLSYSTGNQWTLEELSYLQDQRRSSFTYNKIRKFINWYSGYQISNRLATTIEPVEGSSAETATLFTDVTQSIMTSQNGYEAISEAFKACLTTGISFISPYMDYRDDPISGDVRFHVDQWAAVQFDPFFTKMSLEDCSFLARRKFLSRTAVASLFPDETDLIMSLPFGNRDDKFTYMPYARSWGLQRLMNYTEYWRLKWVQKDVLVDMETGETREWTGDRQRLKMMRDVFPQLDVIRKPTKQVERAVIVEGQLIDYQTDLDGLNDYPMTPCLCYYESSYDLWEWKLQSLVRVLRDPQTEINKRRSKAVDLMDKSLGASWIAKKGAVTNPSSLYQTGQGQVVFLKDTANMGDVQRIDNQGVPQSLFALEQEFENDMMDSLGISKEAFGMAENDKIETAGILAKMRQAAGLVSQQGLFGNLRMTQKILGEKTLKLVQANYTPEKVKLMTNKEPTDEFYSKQFLKYNVVVEEGVLTDTQRQSQFVGLAALRQMGVEIPGGDAVLIENSNLHNKKELSDIMKQQSEAAQQQQQQQQKMEMEQQQTAINTLTAKAESDRALAAERLAKIELDKSLNLERQARAEDEEASKALNLIKAIKELESMDLTNLSQKLAMVKSLSDPQPQATDEELT